MKNLVTPSGIVKFTQAHFLKGFKGMTSIFINQVFGRLEVMELEALKSGIDKAIVQKREESAKGLILKVAQMGYTEKQILEMLSSSKTAMA